MKIAIVGGGGYIGSVIAKQLVNITNHEITIFDRFIFQNFNSISKITKTIIKDIRDIVPKDFEGYDVVIDYSGLSNDPSGDLDKNLTIEINQKGRLNLAHCANTAGVKKYIFASSCSVYGASDEIVDENSNLNPLTLYAKSCVEMEEHLSKFQSDSFSVLIFRHGTVFGISDKPRLDLVVQLMLKTAFLESQIYIMGGGNQFRPLISTSSISKYIELLCSKNELISGTYNLSHFNTNMLELGHKIHEFVSQKKSVNLITLQDDNDKRNYAVNNSKLLKKFGEHFSDFNDDLEKLWKQIIYIDLYDPRYITQKWYKHIIEHEKVQVLASKFKRDF